MTVATEVLQGRLVLPDRLVEEGQVVLEGGLIQAVVTEGAGYRQTADYRDGYILPGLIDLHVHGIAGADLMDGSRDSLELMSRRFAAHGVTGYLPTTVTQSVDATLRAIESVKGYVQDGQGEGARILGIHLEGPFINRDFKGMQNEAYIVAPDDGMLDAFLIAAAGLISRITLAPELAGAAKVIRRLRDQGIFVSIGHTGATYEQGLAAVRLGATHVTHCFNAMTGLHHRKPGVAGAALVCDDLYAELIADGIHVHPAVMRLLIKIKSRGRVMLVTDAMSATEMPDGVYEFGGQRVNVRGGVARLENGSLASSTVTMDVMVRNLVRLCDVSLIDAVFMASTTPAEALGLGAKKGRLEAGYDGDLAILDRGLRPVASWVEGHPCVLD